MKKNEVPFAQKVSNDLNEKLSPALRSTPGKGEVTVLADEKDGLREYIIETKDDKITALKDAYHAKHDEDYQKLSDFVKSYR